MISIIMVRPQMGENIGAAARVMANFDFFDLRIVSPRDGWPNKIANSMATSSARHIIKNAKIFNDIEGAIKDKEYIYATTARSRTNAQMVISSKNLCHQYMPQPSAIMFGCEKNGLSNEEMQYANAHIYIETSPNASSLNLAQAIAIICYQINSTSQKISYQTKEIIYKEKKAKISQSNKDSVIFFLDKLFSDLRKTSFYKNKQKEKLINHQITQMFVNACFSQKQYNLMHGIINALNDNSYKKS